MIILAIYTKTRNTIPTSRIPGNVIWLEPTILTTPKMTVYYRDAREDTVSSTIPVSI
jgi:hypothetical protein